MMSGVCSLPDVYPAILCKPRAQTGALINSGNAAAVTNARLRMARVGEVNQAGFAVLLDANATIVAASNAPELQGFPWNPSGA